MATIRPAQYHKQPSPAAQRALIVLIMFLLSACAAQAPIPEQPFSSYQQAIKELSQQSHMALHTVAEQDLAHFKHELKKGQQRQQLPSLLLSFPPDSNFNWCYPGKDGQCDSAQAPLFIHSARMAQSLDAMNQLLQDYATLILNLANANNNGINSFDSTTEAQQFQTNTQQILNQLHTLGITKKSNIKGLNLFSSIAAKLADDYLANRQQQSLAEVLHEGQAPLAQIIDMAQTALALTAAANKNYYLNQAPTLLRETINNTASDSTLEPLLILNAKTQTQLALYEVLSQAYGALLGAQQQLIQATQGHSSIQLSELNLLISKIQTLKKKLEPPQ